MLGCTGGSGSPSTSTNGKNRLPNTCRPIRDSKVVMINCTLKHTQKTCNDFCIQKLLYVCCYTLDYVRGTTLVSRFFPAGRFPWSVSGSFAELGCCGSDTGVWADDSEEVTCRCRADVSSAVLCCDVTEWNGYTSLKLNIRPCVADVMHGNPVTKKIMLRLSSWASNFPALTMTTDEISSPVHVNFTFH